MSRNRRRTATTTKCVDFPVEIAVPDDVDLRSGLKQFSRRLRIRGLRVTSAFAEPGHGAHMLQVCGPEHALKAFLVEEAAGDDGLREMLFDGIYSTSERDDEQNS